uniref:ADAMTS/ADAMTS-like cysteine-rich domain-containing protein n=1 Tax=Scleropages formosus TaxID=113540 RepID=A0A8C9T272_SCLFO
ISCFKNSPPSHPTTRLLFLVLCASGTAQPVNTIGQWSAWGPWGPCSRTCGTGIDTRQLRRQCLPSVRYRTTVPFPCSIHSRRHSSTSAHTQNRSQVSFPPTPERPCTLFCSTSGKEQPVLLADKVLDGTRCGPQESGVCANGTCQKVGCDAILGSLASEDHCGVCNGNGKSCKVIKGLSRCKRNLENSLCALTIPRNA